MTDDPPDQSSDYSVDSGSEPSDANVSSEPTSSDSSTDLTVDESTVTEQSGAPEPEGEAPSPATTDQSDEYHVDSGNEPSTANVPIEPDSPPPSNDTIITEGSGTEQSEPGEGRPDDAPENEPPSTEPPEEEETPEAP